MTPILACDLTPDHIGQTVAFYSVDGRRVTGRLEGYCRHLSRYMLIVDGSRFRDVRHGAEIDVMEVAA